MTPIIVVLSVVGSYAINRNLFDVYTMVFFGLIGYVMVKAHFSTAGIVLALVLGNMAEIGYRQSVVMAKGNVLSYYIHRPICIIIFALIILSLLIPVVQSVVKSRKKKAAA